MTGRLKGRSAVITGGLTGQGLAIAEAFAAEGANVAVGSFVREASGRQGDAAAYPDPREIAEVRVRLAAAGTAVHAGHLDVRDSEAIEQFVAAAEAVCGPTDILVNAAGTTAEQPVSGHSDELWLKIIDTNLNGAFRMTRRLLPGMIGRKWGRIINIGSTAATVGWKDNPAYCASKSGLLGLTRCVALEGAPHGVTCMMISPTWVETELMRRNVRQVVEREGSGRTLEEAMADIAAQNPQNRIIQPDEIAALAAFLCGEGARGITMENIQITGGALW
ncbi:3-oxoacyl-ACP reductase [Sinorhizobium medicae]|uniref:3-oxoacyl-ACP reductase n=1 Tax=Sinorhizobium medicae TaxID=110321 RepID=A0A508WZP6_9HYPH|nr:SDR family oxidoreductase [Sinorhizobium medicae]MDX0455000.1 SDR family oxidoreductase [Sinorhizobium medicae]MDX0514293.1 SDR family oxidoreductase [Sinorhizobium medicae]MDX0547037.1 SDR family oxidoreductase [Sinorhizobium medicae]MDX0560124.1 SDR family oxidoreductase [Sinorhizobium medicae]MDX0634689.1 SDR family oxidoreductase [Sinorhizobium medicae]